MALEFLDNGLISLENREAHFEKGNPTDPEKWGMFKYIPEDAKKGDIEVTIYSINECFSKVKDSWSGMTLRSSMDQFKVFCESNDLIFRERMDAPSVIIRHKINCR